MQRLATVRPGKNDGLVQITQNFHLFYTKCRNINHYLAVTFELNMLCLTINGQIKRRLHNVMFALWFNRIEIKLTQ